MIYLRPVPLPNGSSANAQKVLPLGCGWAFFTDVEVLVRGENGNAQNLGIYPAMTLSSAFPEEATAIHKTLARITTPRLGFEQPLIMGILNATPDSFSDGGVYNAEEAAARRMHDLIEGGAALVDIGGESTRPGADFIPADEELRRITPALEAAAREGTPVSVDTRKAEVAHAALKLGARVFNDVSALSFDTQSVEVAAAYAEAGGRICLMHAQGDPRTMQDNPVYEDVLLDVYDYLAARIAACEAAGISREALIVDPGIGFGKTLAHNLALLGGLSLLHGLGCPVLLGASRKRFIGMISGEDEAARRAPGSIAAALFALSQGVQILRVHDVRETRQAVDVWMAMRG